MKLILRVEDRPGALLDALREMDIRELTRLESFPVMGNPGIYNFNVEGMGITLTDKCEVVDEFPGTQAH